MLVIIALIILLITPAVMIFIRLLRPRFAYQYLLALFSTLIAWPLVLLSRPDTFQMIPLIPWQPESVFPYSPVLLLDHYSWPFALSVSTLVLGVMLTAVTRLNDIKWRTWAGSLLIASCGLLAVLAGNPLTLLIAWAALDISEASILMVQANDALVRQKIILVLSVRAAGIVVLLVAMIVAWSSGDNLSFLNIQPQSALLLLVAAGLRSGVFPLHIPFILETQFRRGLGTTLRLVSAAASFILVARTATSGIDLQIAPYLLALIAIAALYGAAAWATAPDELSGRTFWILGTVSLSVSASIRAQPEASIAWGVACVLSGALIFLASPRYRFLMPLLILGVLSISSLPFTPSWNGWQAYGVLPAQQTIGNLILHSLIAIIFFVVHILLIMGYLRILSHQVKPTGDIERWTWVLYLPGLFILIIAQFIFGFYELPELSTVPLAGWLSGVIVSIVSLSIWIRGRFLLYKVEFIPRYLWRLEPVLHFSWLYRFLGAVYRLVGRIVTTISSILEGEGGLLWTMLIVLLLFSLFRG
jgi:hypothetical protein